MPLLLTTSLCHVVVTWERRTQDTRMFALERFCLRGSRLSTTEVEGSSGEATSAVAAAPIRRISTTPSPFLSMLPPGTELTNHNLPVYCLVDEVGCTLAQRKAFHLACQLWAAGGISTRLVLKRTSVSAISSSSFLFFLVSDLRGWNLSLLPPAVVRQKFC